MTYKIHKKKVYPDRFINYLSGVAKALPYKLDVFDTPKGFTIRAFETNGQLEDKTLWEFHAPRQGSYMVGVSLEPDGREYFYYQLNPSSKIYKLYF